MISISDKQKHQLLENYNVWEEKENKNGDITTRLNHINLAELIFNGLNLHFLTTIDNEEIYYFNGGYYEPNGTQIIKDLVEQFLNDIASEHYKREIVGHIRDKNYQKREIFDSTPHLINLENGVYDIKHNKFFSHDPGYYFLTSLPITYDKKAKIKEIKKFLKSTVYPEDIPRIQEIFGYCLYRQYHIHKSFMFIGNGANGKSTVLNLLKTMLGQHNTSGVALQDLDTSQFATGELYNKLANIYPDISSNSLSKTGKFKMLTGNDMMSAEKKFKSRFNFTNYAKLIFSCNQLPEAKDDSDAFFRRWELLTFPYKFEGKNCDKNIMKRLTTPGELSGLFNWSLTGLRRLLKNNDFSNTRTTEDMRTEYLRKSSPIASFVMDCLEFEATTAIKKDDLYMIFCEYCRGVGLPAVPKNVFSMKLHQHIKVTDTKKTIGGKRWHCWSGITLKQYKNDVQGVQPVQVFPFINCKRGNEYIKLCIKLDENVDNPDTPDTLDDYGV